MRDAVPLLAILARVRRRLRTLAALEGMVGAAAVVVAVIGVAIAIARWRALPVSTAALPVRRLEIAAALAMVALGALAGALRRIPLDRCASFVDRALDAGGPRHDRVLSALAFARTGNGGATRFMRAAIDDAVAHAKDVAPGSAAPLRRPRALPAFAAAAILLGVGALSPMPARGSRPPANPLASAAGSAEDQATVRVRMPGRTLDPERDEIAAALRAAKELRDPELATLARGLATAVTDLSNRGLDAAEAFDRLSELLRRADEAATDVAELPHALNQAGGALQAGAATRDSGLALSAEDGAATDRALNDLAARAAAAAAAERDRIAASLDRAGDRVGAIDDARTAGAQSSAPAPGTAAGSSSASMTAGPDPQSGAAADQTPSQRRLARDQPQPPTAQPGQPGQVARAPGERRLQRLQRELKQTASACRTDPDACRQKLKRQARELPRMEDEARSLAPRQRLAEAVRQLRERLRREGGGAGERGREERRFLRAARGEKARNHGTKPDDGEARTGERVLAEDPDDVGGESDEMETDGPQMESDADGAGESAPLAGGDSERSEGAAGETNPGQGAQGQDSANGDGIGNQRGNEPLGERGTMITRGRSREAAVKDGAGPTRSQVIQAAAQRGFAHTSYNNVFVDYQAVVEESLEGSAVPPGRRYIVRRYFQLIRPQSARSPHAPAPRGD